MRTASGPEAIDGFSEPEEIGRGGFSTVYRARQDQFARTVALKVLAVDLRRDRDAERRFKRECVLSAQLSGHPNVVTVFDGNVTPRGTAYLVSEYCPRGSLADQLAARGRLTLGEVLRYGQEIASALEAAHERGVLHRDVKPENILLTEFGHAALTDFGIASMAGAGALSMSQNAMTTHHAPPELLETAAEVQPTPAADVYALGSTLWTLASGQPPYVVPGGSWIQFVHRVVSGKLPDNAPGVPPELRDVLARAMATDPAHRPTAAQLGAMLASLERGGGNAVPEQPFGVPGNVTVGRQPPGGQAVPAGAGGAWGGPPPGAAGPSSAAAWSAEPAYANAYSNAYTGPAPGGAQTSLRRFEQAAPLPGWEAPEDDAPRPRRQLVLAGLALLVLALAVGAGLAVLRGRAHPSVGAGAPSAPAASVDPQVADASRATGVTVDRSGSTAVLHWTNGTGYAFLAVKQDPGSTASPALTVITDPQATTTTVSGLSAAQRYCWTVVSIVEPGNPPVTTSSQPACSG